jgi:hypothetical protein
MEGTLDFGALERTRVDHHLEQDAAGGKEVSIVGKVKSGGFLFWGIVSKLVKRKEIYPGEPTRTFELNLTRWLFLSRVLQENPKSTSLSETCLLIKIFSGFISKCARPLDWRYSRPKIKIRIS